MDVEVKITSERMEVEFIEWTCPKCKTVEKIIEFAITDRELYCMECNTTSKMRIE